MTSKIVTFFTSVTLLLLGFCLLWMIWSQEKAFLLISENRLLFTFLALFLLFLSVANFTLEARPLPSFTFNLIRGKGTVSIETLKKGIQRYVKSEDPNLQLISCKLKEGGKLLELVLAGKKEPSLIERLSNLLADQFGFEGQLDIYFEK